MFKTFKFNKLIRDKLVDFFIQKGAQVKLKEVNSESDLISYFKKKIVEEAHEVRASTSHEELIEELADILEVAHGLAKAINIDFEDIEDVRLEKLEKKGGFSKQIIVDHVTVDSDHEFVTYFEKVPDKYPEIKV